MGHGRSLELSVYHLLEVCDLRAVSHLQKGVCMPALQEDMGSCVRRPMEVKGPSSRCISITQGSYDMQIPVHSTFEELRFHISLKLQEAGAACPTL